MPAIRGRQRTAFQDRYSIQMMPGTAQITDVPRFNPAIDVGIFGTGSALGAYLLDLINHPHLQPPNSTEFTRLTTGKPQMSSREYQQLASEIPSVSLEMQLNAYVMAMFIKSFFQDGARDNSGIVYGFPYTISDVSAYMSIVRQLDQSTFVDPTGDGTSTVDLSSHYLTGMVANSLSLNFEEGSSGKLTAECNAAQFGIMNVCGKLNRYTYNTRKLYVRPTPYQVNNSYAAAAPESGLVIKHEATAFTVNTVANEAAFSALSAGTVEVAIDTGAINFAAADAAAFHGELIHHNAYQAGAIGETWAYTHPSTHQPTMVAPLLWQNATNYMRGAYYYDGASGRENPLNWLQVKLPGLSLTLNNNLVARLYDEPWVDSYVLGDLSAEGNITIPWGTDKALDASRGLTMGGNTPLIDFMQGFPSRLRTIFGPSTHIAAGSDPDAVGSHVAHASAEYGMTIDMAIRYNENSLEGENELGQVMGYSVVELEGPDESVFAGASVVDDKTLPIVISVGTSASKVDHGLANPAAYPSNGTSTFGP